MITDEYLQRVRQLPKRVSNPQARWTEKPGHRQRNFQAAALDSDETFRIFQRLNLTDEKDFSCGIQLVQRGEEDLTLARYNGPSHRQEISHTSVTFITRAKKLSLLIANQNRRHRKRTVTTPWKGRLPVYSPITTSAA